jgi:iron complex transport system substrate-binding protein
MSRAQQNAYAPAGRIEHGRANLFARRREAAEECRLEDLDQITGAIVGESIQIHRALGPGLMESVYEAVLARALERRGYRVERQKVIRFEYDGMVFEEGFRADLVVEDQVIVEVKSVETISRAHPKQLLSYLKLTNRQVGLLINFGAPTIREGLRRIVNGFLPFTVRPRPGSSGPA